MFLYKLKHCIIYNRSDLIYMQWLSNQVITTLLLQIRIFYFRSTCTPIIFPWL